jgi:hypothetical protein
MYEENSKLNNFSEVLSFWNMGVTWDENSILRIWLKIAYRNRCKKACYDTASTCLAISLGFFVE